MQKTAVRVPAKIRVVRQHTRHRLRAAGDGRPAPVDPPPVRRVEEVLGRIVGSRINQHLVERN
eukprot:6740524-Prymnesium_polylepis.1